jgi:hypothetical protein
MCGNGLWNLVHIWPILKHMFDEVEVLEVGGKIAGFDASCASRGDLCSAAVALARLQSQVGVALAHVLAGLDARSVTDADFGMTTATWLAREAGIPATVARRHLKTGKVLRALPVLDEAVVGGTVSVHHALAVADASNPRVAEVVAGMQAELVDLARGAVFEAWRNDVRMLIALADEDGGHDPHQDLTTNRLEVAETIDGLTHLSGELTGEHGLTVRHAIDTKADELFHRFRSDHQHCPDIEVPGLATLRALALTELVRAGGAVDMHSTRPPRPEVTIVVRAEEPGSPVDPGGVALADGTTRVLCCDPDLYAVVVDSLGVPLDLGRHTRLATTAQRRAIAARDGGCVFPGCDAPIAWSDMHHIHHYEHGGPTDIANLAALCRRHHGVTHRKGWQMHATPDGWFSWQGPNGHTCWSQRHHRRRPEPAPPPDP